MGTSSSFNEIVDEIKARITNNSSALGFGAVVNIYEKDEHPAVLAENNQVPCALVIPLVYGGDQMPSVIDGNVTSHKFNITVVGLYTFSDPVLETALRAVRGYGFTFIDLFASKTNQQVKYGVVVDKKLEQFYFIVGGNLILYWIASLDFVAFLPLA
jgi:hypothetical protein